jgi:spore germination protein KB
MGDGKISQRQLAFLFFTILIGTMFFHNPQIVVGTTGQDGWIAYLIASFWGILVALVMVALGQRFPDQTLTGYIPNILGKPLGKILSLLYTIWFLFIGGGVLAQFANFMNTTIMASTPKMVFIITFVAIAYYAVNLGLETFVRVNELLLWVIVIAIVLVVTLPYELMDLRRMLPVGQMSIGRARRDFPDCRELEGRSDVGRNVFAGVGNLKEYRPQHDRDRIPGWSDVDCCGDIIGNSIWSSFSWRY